MGKKLDPKDLAIQYVMTAPLEAACAFVETLGAVVKARGKQAVAIAGAKQEQARNTAAARPSRARTTPARDIKLVDPNAPAEQQELPATSGASPAAG